MPRLPSGKLVGITLQPAIEVIRNGDFNTHMAFLFGARSVSDLPPVISVIYYRSERNGLPEDAYLPGVTVHDVEERRCGWPDEDYDAFEAWLRSDKVREWQESSYQELLQAIRDVRVKLPPALHGILEDDD